MHWRVFIQTYPNAFYISLSAVFSFFGLAGMTPSFMPLVLTLAACLLYAPILIHRHQYRYTALLWVCISLCSSLGQLAPTLSALSTAGSSLAVLLTASSLTSALALLVIAIDVLLCSRIGATQAVLFPALWATLWVILSHTSLGRLTSWTPVLGTESYSWMTPWVGPAGLDWVVAGWAVVISQSIGNWYMGCPEDDLVKTRTAGTISTTSGTWVLATVLTALAIPPFIISGLPLPVNPIESVSILSVGCALPPFWKYNTATPTLENYIEESRTIDAKVILWPEGAVSFRNTSDKEAGFKKIAEAIIQQHKYWAVAFEVETTDPSGHASMGQTGVALLSHSTDVHIEYYKRHLVPVAESFSLTPGSSPPPTYDLPLNPPPKAEKSKWAPDSPYIRPIELTASICLDFAMPSPFRDLDSKPALILAPARTWDPAIGVRMWEEAKMRANEIGSLALWCDGGKGGVSGVAGRGYNEIHQVGEGSWSRTVGIQYPFDSSRTLYARFGDTLVLAASWFLVIATLSRFNMAASHIHAAGMRCVRWVMERRASPPPVTVDEAQRNLIQLDD